VFKVRSVMKVRTPRVNLLHLLLLGERTFDCSYFFVCLDFGVCFRLLRLCLF